MATIKGMKKAKLEENMRKRLERGAKEARKNGGN